ncbi:ptk2p [Saccharomyces arboricola H-6]|uniref:non-specific serine/threonine protein kinase n=1 Tax=Saccharomyces arboricola (strain H-6 / AS 2.3317 / CBS 10644) TaxID=1160507 RepID=J8Q324_SACAR|nr:ptk2p [Saccharomyces arboricola H-6]
MTGNSKDKEVHKSPSVSTLKLLGKRLFNSNNHTDNSSLLLSAEQLGNGRSLRKRPTSPPNGSASSGGNSPSSSAGARQRSASLHRRKNNASGAFSSGPVSSHKSSAALQDLIKHNNNPYLNSPSNILGTGTGIASTRDRDRTILDREKEMEKVKEKERNTHHAGLPQRSNSMASHHFPNENIIYNPYGISPNHVRPDTAFADTLNMNKENDLSFYMHDGNSKIRMLPLPIANPNEFLPEDMKQFSVHLTDNFTFDTDNKPIGSGGSSEVRKVKSSYKQKDVYALKKLNMIYHESPEKFYKRCSKEFIIAKHLSHNVHITKTFYLVKVPTTTYTTRGWGFIMELGVKDLFQLMERTGWKNVPFSEKYCLFKQVAQGIKFCHDNGIAHRDLKPENVLISKEGICKLTDFGISDWYHVVPHDYTSPVKTCQGMIGSPPYTPPEVMYFDAKKHYPERFQKPYNPLAMDSYALGIMLITMVNNIIPFIDSCNTDARYREFEVSYDNFINHQNPHFRDKGCHKPGPGAEYTLARNFKNPDATRVAWRLADPNPATRYTMDDLFEDPFFQQIETCVEPEDDDLVKAPELRKTTSVSDLTENPLDAPHEQEVAHTSNPFLKKEANTPKPRSMLEIAQSPSLRQKSKLKNNAKAKPQVAADEKDDKSIEPKQQGQGEDLNEGKDEKEIMEDTSINVDSLLERPTPTSTNVENILREDDSTAKELKSMLNSIPATPTHNGPTPAPVKTASPLDKHMSDLSLKSVTPAPTKNLGPLNVSSSSNSLGSLASPSTSTTKKKKVIHHHLDITNSVTNTSSVSAFVSR